MILLIEGSRSSDSKVVGPAQVFATGIVFGPGLMAAPASAIVAPPVAVTHYRRRIQCELADGQSVQELAAPESVVIWRVPDHLSAEKLASSTGFLVGGSSVEIVGYRRQGMPERLWRQFWGMDFPQFRVRAQVTLRDENNLIVTDCPQFVGSRGAAVLDEGYVVGICTCATEDGCIMATPVEAFAASLATATQ